MFRRQQYVFLDRFLDDTGTSTPEYAIVTFGAVTIALVLVAAARSQSVGQAISDLLENALKVSP